MARSWRGLTACATVCLPVLAYGQASGPEIAVNTTTAEAQSRPRAAMDASGRTVVVWQSNGQDGGAEGIYARRFSILGAPLAGELQVNLTTAGSQALPAVSTDDAGNFVVVWEGDDASGRGILARLFSAAGAPLSGEIAVNATTAGDQLRPAVAMDGSGKFAVVWEGPDADGTGVYLQRFDVAGVPQGPEQALNTHTALDQRRAVIAVDLGGLFVACWESAGQDGDGLGVYARRYEADGTPRDAAEFKVNTTTAGDQSAPALAAAPNGDFVVVWQGAQAMDADGGIFAQRYLQNGAARGAEFRVNSSTAGARHAPDVALDGSGNFVVLWAGPDAVGDGVFGQRYRTDGAAQGLEFVANVETAGTQAEASVAMNRKLQPLVDAQAFAMAWTSPDASLEGVTARLGSFGNSVTVLAPDEGRSWAVGSSQRIRFSHTLPAGSRSFRIELIVNGGPPQLLQGALAGSRTMGNYLYTVADPGLPGGPFTGVIRVTSVADPSATDDSVPFPIEPPTISLVAPPPDVVQGVVTEIRWSHNLGLQSHVKVELARDGVAFGELLSPDVTNAWVHEGRLAWTPTGTCATPSSCKVKLSWLADRTVTGTSAPFDIVKVLFVNNTAGPGGNGSMAMPFHTLAAAEAASVAGNWIFVHEGDGTTTGYDQGITLKDHQKLLGQGVDLVVAGTTVVSATNPPKLKSFSSNLVTLAQNNEVAGVTLQTSSGPALRNGGALGAASVRDLTVEFEGGPFWSGYGLRLDAATGSLSLTRTTISGAGGGIRISGGSPTLAGTDNTISVTSGFLLDIENTTGGSVQLTSGTLSNTDGIGLVLRNNGGSSYTFDNVSINGRVTGGAVQVDGAAPAAVSFNGLRIATTEGEGLVVANAGTLNVGPLGGISSSIATTQKAALKIFNTATSAVFASVSATNSAANGIEIRNVSGSVLLGSGSIAGSAGIGFDVDAGTAAVSYAGSISQSGGSKLVSIRSRRSGSGAVTLSGNLSCTFCASGIDVSDNFDAGPITFSGAAKTLDAAGFNSNAVALTGNHGTTIAFSNGGLVLTSNGSGVGAGFKASNNGTLTVTGSGNSVASRSSDGVTLLNTTIGPAGVTFDSVSVEFGDNGITIDNAGAGAFVANGGTMTGVRVRGLDVNLGSGDVTYAGSIAIGFGGRAVEVTGRTGGSVTIGGNIEDRSLGILVQNNAAPSVITFSGTSKVLTAGSPLQLLSNPGVVINLDNGGLDVDTSGQGLVATGGGSVNIRGPNNTIDTTSSSEGILVNGVTLNIANGLAVTTVNGTGLSITGTSTITGNGLAITTGTGTGLKASALLGPTVVTITGTGHSITTGMGGMGTVGVDIQGGPTIGPGGITFESVSVDGANAGIVLRNAGAGAFVADGGSLANVLSRGIEILGGSGDVTYGGSISTSVDVAATSVYITGRTGGTVTLAGNINGGGIEISGNSGSTFNLTGASKIVNSGNFDALKLDGNGGSTINLTGGGLAVTTTIGKALQARFGGTINVTGSGNSIVTTTGTAVNIDSTTIGSGGILFDSVSMDGAFDGIVLYQTGAGAFRANGGSLANVLSRGVSVNGGSGAFAYAGSISTSGTNARSVEVMSHAGGAMEFTGAITDSGRGIFVGGDAGSIVFSGGLTLNTGNSAGFQAAGVGGGGMSLAITGADNTITTAGATALFVSHTTIAPAGLTFRSISSGSSTDPSYQYGISLDSTGTLGGLRVTGNGGTCTLAAPTCSGGRIQNKPNGGVGVGIYLNNTAGVSLALMHLNDFEHFAIRGTNVTGFSLSDSIVDGVNGDNSAAGSEEGAIRFDGLYTSGAFPTAAISNSVIGGTAAGDASFSDNLRVTNGSGTLNRLVVTNTRFGNVGVTGNNGLTLAALNDGTVMNLTVEDSVFTSGVHALAKVDASQDSLVDVVFRRNKLSNDNASQAVDGNGLRISGGSGASTLGYDVSCNSFRDARGAALLVAAGDGAGISAGSIVNNAIGVSGVSLSGSAQGSGIQLTATGSGTHSARIRDNVVHQTNEAGILIQNDAGSATLNASVFGNVVAEPGASSIAGLRVDAGVAPADTSRVNLVVGSAGTAVDKNDFSAGDPADSSDVRLAAGGGGSIALSRNGSASGTLAGVIDDDNLDPASTNTTFVGTITLVSTLPATPPGVAACTIPP